MEFGMLYSSGNCIETNHCRLNPAAAKPYNLTVMTLTVIIA